MLALLLEDEPLIAMDLEMTLSNVGFDVATVGSCEQASSWLDRNRPEIAVVDIALSDGDCSAVVERLTATGVPFIVHSGDPSHMHHGIPFEHGTWISKPSLPSDLAQAAQSLLVG